MSVKEMAKGITYDDPIKTRYVFQSGEDSHSLLTWTGIWLRLAGVPQSQLCLGPLLTPTTHSQLDTPPLCPEHV